MRIEDLKTQILPSAGKSASAHHNQPFRNPTQSTSSEPWFLGPGWRLFGILFLTLLLPTGLFVLLTSAQARITLREQAIQQNALAAQLASRALEEHFQGMTNYVESFARRSGLIEAIQRGDETTLRSQLRDLVTKNLEFDRAFVVDANGVEWCDYPSVPEVRGKNFSFRDWYQGVSRTRQSYISEIYQREAEPRRFVTAIAAPIRNGDGDTLGYLVAQHTIENLSSWLAQIRPPFADSLVLIDQNGTLVSRTGTGNEPPLNLIEDPFIQKALAGRAGTEEAPNPLTAEKSLISYVTAERSGWGVLSIQSLDAAFVPIRKLRNPFLILTLAFLAGLFALHAILLHMIRRHHLAEKEAKAALRVSEEKLRAVVETARDAIVSANQSGKIIFWNKCAEEFFGYTADEAVGKPLTLLMPERFHEAHRKGLEQFVATAESHLIGKTVELTGLRKGGGEFPLEISLSHWMLKDEHYFTAIVRDITERKRAEQAQRELGQKELELARAKVEREQLELFAFAASHDLQEPLHKVIAFGDLLELHAVHHLDEKSRSYIQHMCHAAERMSQLLQDLLNFCRVTTKVEPFERISLKEVIRDILKDLEFRIKESEAQIEVEDLPDVQADRSQMHQLFQNLIVNALKFQKMEEPPRIRIRSSRPSPGWVEVEVEDSGVGFDRKHLDRIFKPFERLHNPHEYPGSGMGLAICQKIAARHGGRITAQSSVGEGSVFIVTLPEPSREG